MPPVRTVSAAKPMKTERTHEENQERAYIAASRRSDRSLEARIESARRASEIHKKRTGRALRVTEQDVVNEEMYEEEDDDLPAQYRRLTAHLQTNSVDFNRKLQAYLATHHAGRQALMDPSMMGFFGQGYPNAPNFAPQTMPQSQMQQQMLPPQMVHRSPQSFRSSPYPVPPQGFKAAQHQRSQSFAAPQELHAQQQQAPVRADSKSPEEQRRASLPAQSVAQPVRSPSGSPTATRPGSSRSNTDFAANSTQAAQAQGTPTSCAQQPAQQQGQHMPFTFTPHMPFHFDPSAQNMNFSPFSMALPTESQQMLAPTMDPTDPSTPMFMQSGDMMSQPFYSYNPNPSSKSRLQNPSTQGMHQTLAPSAGAPMNDMMSESMGYTLPDHMNAQFNPSFNFLDSSYQDAFKAPMMMSRDHSAHGSSGLVTPNNEWSKFIDGTMFEEIPSASQ
ncbi:hypothetical protein K490DRAFT_68611 [Saccharata proteae CBS 121410]|uniref:Uncharacterized protein n=1 Tax=Saccharata proteae CBS 121410 TaxID=1314787 RepID=A0A9P4HMS0_9PEZI|nr:hypothetical protein K490DRAFT_68611 [Saccharata proteae CBS 121410]